MEKVNVRVSFQMPIELRDAAQQKAQAEDVTVSQVVRWYLRAWVDGDIPTRPPRPPKAEPDPTN